MAAFDELGAFQELLGEVKALRTDMTWLKASIEAQGTNVVEIYSRLRELETDVASIKANQRPPISGWALFGIVATVVATVLLVLDRIYVNQ
jgi:hypothetical protein